MSRFEQDTIKRQIRQMGEVVAAILTRAHAEQDLEFGLRAIREATATDFGLDRSLLDRLDVPSAAVLLRVADRVRLYAQVCTAEAELLETLGRVDEATRLRGRAALSVSASDTLPSVS